MKVVFIVLCVMLLVVVLVESLVFQIFVLVLYLVDNLDELDVLGYCLDIVGCGLFD